MLVVTVRMVLIVGLAIGLFVGLNWPMGPAQLTLTTRCQGHVVASVENSARLLCVP